MSAVPTFPAGVSIVTEEAVVERTIAAAPPTVTELMSLRLLPLMTVLVAPLRGPDVTESDEIWGTVSDACTWIADNDM